MTTQEAKFKKYLLWELIWEIEQHDMGSDFPCLNEDDSEVLCCSGYHDLKVMIEGFVYAVHLSWQKDTPPTLLKEEQEIPTKRCT